MTVSRLKALGIGAALIFIFVPVLSAQTSIDLSGSWRFDVDRADAGVAEHWFEKSLSGLIHLPGSMAENGLGDDIAPDSPWTGTIVNRSWLDDPANVPYLVPGKVKLPFWLNPVKIYVGPAWYQKDIKIPDLWKGRRIVLFLERAHWETRLWVDGREVGTQNSLATPHVYDLTALLLPGPHTLTLRIDNRIKDIDVGVNAHSVTDHSQTNWNGVIGRISLVSGPMIYLDDVRIVPDTAARTANITAVIRNLTGAPARGTLNLQAQTVIGLLHRAGPLSVPFAAEGEEAKLEIQYALGAEAPLWDEFDPSVFELEADLRTDAGERLETRVVRFGFRDFRAAGSRFTNNGRPVFLRGTVDCAVFPDTGYPPTQKRDWLRTFKILKEYGLNHVRFHSWCPPEGAFDAADEAGMFLYVECGAWTKIGDGAPIDAWLYAESERIVRAYGNHPSFVMMSYGNEPDGDKAGAFLAAFVSSWKTKDPRRLYTSAAGWPALPENDFQLSPEPRLRHWAEGMNNRLDRLPPETAFDFRDVIAKWNVPVVGHEVGQWCAYPDFREIPKFGGVLRPGNFEIFRDSLAAAGLAKKADDFVNASGRLQVLCYKADIEAALRTPGFAGFELLGLADFPGQGTAPVGVLDVFNDAKPYAGPAAFRGFCGPTVPLARMSKLIYTSDDTFAADIEAAHFGPFPIPGTDPEWVIGDVSGKILTGGKFPRLIVPQGSAVPLGEIRLSLAPFKAPGRYTLAVKLETTVNSWNFWVYPSTLPPIPGREVRVVRSLDADTAAFLRDGGRVILTAAPGSVRPEKGGAVAVGFSSIFWNTSWTKGNPPRTLGLLADPRHPALAAFPTDGYADFQWWDAMTHAQAIVLSDFGKDFEPIVRIIDDWATNRPLGLIFEIKVGKGRLIVTGIDLLTDAENRPAARQLLHSLKAYAAGRSSEARAEAGVETIQALFR